VLLVGGVLLGGGVELAGGVLLGGAEAFSVIGQSSLVSPALRRPGTTKFCSG
jgi:hypothetical protein